MRLLRHANGFLAATKITQSPSMRRAHRRLEFWRRQTPIREVRQQFVRFLRRTAFTQVPARRHRLPDIFGGAIFGQKNIRLDTVVRMQHFFRPVFAPFSFKPDHLRFYDALVIIQTTQNSHHSRKVFLLDIAVDSVLLPLFAAFPACDIAGIAFAAKLLRSLASMNLGKLCLVPCTCFFPLRFLLRERL